MVGMRNLDGGRVSFRELTRVNVDDEAVTKYSLRPNDVLFNRTNSFELVGKTAIVPDDVPAQTVFASYLVRLFIDPGTIRPDLLCSFMNTPAGRRQLLKLTTPGVSQFNINPSELLARFLVPVAPKAAQATIADVSSQFETAVFCLEQLLKSKRRLKRGLAQQLLTGKRRFPGFVCSRETVQTRFGSFPADWDHVKVGEIASEVSDRAEQATGTVPVLSCTKHRGLVESAKYFGKQVFSDDTGNYRLVRRGQFAYATNHIEEGSIGLLTEFASGLVSPMYTVFSTAERVDAPFLYALFKTELYRHIFQVNTSASVDRRGSLRWSQFARLPLFLPSLAEQRRIVEVLETCDREIASLNRQLELLKDQKTGLMQKLLTGQIRVKETLR